MQDGKHVILCIDDDEDVREYLKTVLEAEGYIYAEAQSAEEGLRAYKDVKPDLIIVDLMMESVDAGTNLVKELKLAGATVPVYMLSSVGDDLHIVADYSELGLAGILQKPVAREHLISVIKGKLEQ